MATARGPFVDALESFQRIAWSENVTTCGEVENSEDVNFLLNPEELSLEDLLL